jgi:hypothetical protein
LTRSTREHFFFLAVFVEPWNFEVANPADNAVRAVDIIDAENIVENDGFAKSNFFDAIKVRG